MAEAIAGFILDVRIPVPDLSLLGLEEVETSQGLLTGERIASRYLRAQKSPFRNVPILLLSVSSTLTEQAPGLASLDAVDVVVKSDPMAADLLSKWLGEIKGS